MLRWLVKDGEGIDLLEPKEAADKGQRGKFGI